MTSFDPAAAPKFCQWDVWQANWEHEDGTVKARPVLILSSTATANAIDHIWVAKFTKTRTDNPFRIEFHKADPSFAETGLTDTCYLYVSEARKIPKTTMLHRRGKLPILSATLMGFLVRQALKFRIQ